MSRLGVLAEGEGFELSVRSLLKGAFACPDGVSHPRPGQRASTVRRRRPGAALCEARFKLAEPQLGAVALRAFRAA